MKTYANAEDAVTAEVQQIPDGRFAVILRDNDSGEALPHIRIYVDESAAIAYAESLVNN